MLRRFLRFRACAVSIKHNGYYKLEPSNAAHCYYQSNRAATSTMMGTQTNREDFFRLETLGELCYATN